MKTTSIFFILLFYSTHCFSQQVGINTENPTECLDVNGGVRFRGIPQIGKPKYVVSVDDTGRAYRWSYDSVQQQIGGGDIQVNTLSLISADTITTGDCVAIGDGTSGIYRIGTVNYPFTADPFKNTWWLAQTFITESKTKALKSVIFDLEANATTPANIIICSVKNVSGGVPVGADINGQTGTLEGPLGSGGFYTNGRIVFDPPLPLLPNTTYALVFKASLSSTNMQLHKQDLGMYPSGYACVSFNSGSTWQIQSTFDFNVSLYFCETQEGKAYRSLPTSGGVGWNTTNSCLESNGCPATFFGKNDQYDNVVGIALHDALPGQLVSVQVGGFTDLINSFPLGRKLFLGTPPGKLATTGTKSVGISTGNGMIIQVTY